MIDNHQRHVASTRLSANFLEFSSTDERGRIWRVTNLKNFADHAASRTFGELS